MINDKTPRPEKVAVVDEVRQRLEGTSATILTEYRGLSVDQLAQLRSALRNIGGDFKVYKNTLVRFAARDLNLDIEGLLTGPTALAFVTDKPDGTPGDAVDVAKVLKDFGKDNPALVLKGGVLGEDLLSAEDTNALAEVEPREVLLAKFAGGLAAPMQKMAGLLQALPRNMAYGLKALIDQGGAPGAPVDEPVAEVATPAEDAPAEEAPDEQAPAEEAPAEDAAAPEAEAPEAEAPAPTEDAPAAEADTPETPETDNQTEEPVADDAADSTEDQES